MCYNIVSPLHVKLQLITFDRVKHDSIDHKIHKIHSVIVSSWAFPVGILSFCDYFLWKRLRSVEDVIR